MYGGGALWEGRSAAFAAPAKSAVARARAEIAVFISLSFI
jgi:hypothetical protein